MNHKEFEKAMTEKIGVLVDVVKVFNTGQFFKVVVEKEFEGKTRTLSMLIHKTTLFNNEQAEYQVDYCVEFIKRRLLQDIPK